VTEKQHNMFFSSSYHIQGRVYCLL